MKKMTSKDLHVALKNQATEEELMERYGVDSSEELYEVMSKVAPGNFEYFKKEIKKNQKNRLRKDEKKKMALDNQKEDEQIELTNFETLTDQSSEVENGKVGKNMVDYTAVEKPTNDEPKPSLNELLEAEKFLSDNCVSLEKEHNALINARREDVKTLALIKRTLEELKRLLQVNQSKLTTVLEDYNSKAEQMLRVSSEISACKEMLADTRAQIEEAKKLKVSVFSDGTIECENGELESPCEAEVSQLFSTLILLAAAEELTIKQVKTVAKLVSVVKKIDQKYELEFDSDLVQKLYEAAIA
ncbi:MAG: hypothetical protein ACLTF2_01855 [Clostridia bacterium]|jgi:hypothetical protein